MNQFYFFGLIVLLFISCSGDGIEDLTDVVDVKLQGASFATKDDLKIAVIGGGIASASYVHFINQSIGSQCEIIIYERNNRLGGRVKKDTLGGGLVEQGATLIHSSNHYLQDIMASYNLERAVPHGGEGEAETLALWDGEDFVLNTSTNEVWSSIQMLWAYGNSLFDVESVVKRTIPQWQSIYTHLQDGKAFKSPKEMFETIGLYDMTQQSSYDYFKKEGIKDKVIYEFIDCVSRVNYHQDGNINAFTDVVSLAGAGMDGGELLSVKGGNDLMIKSALSAQNVNLRMSNSVSEIYTIPIDSGSQHVVKNEQGSTDTFDIVVVACPLDLAGISLPQYDVKMDREYQEVHAHFVAGDIDYSYFGDISNEPQTIFTMEKEEVPFISIAKTGYADEWNLPIYKVFSRNYLEQDFFDDAFTNVKGQFHQEWKAYTVLSPMKEWPPFEISKGLYYINAMESAVSAMETQAVAARNAANLTIDYLQNELKD